MNAYNLITVEERNGNTTTLFTVPVDNNGNSVDYLHKNRVILNNQMLVFNTEQEYRDWVEQNA